jgi:hypothetical protein
MKKGVFLFLPILFLFGCGKAKSPSERAARDFMDNYYVATDLRSALEIVDGYALEKIKKSLELIEGQRIDASTHRPKISYTLLESRVEGTEADYLFQVVIEPEKIGPLRKKTLLKIREREKGVWKVTQFSDFDTE